MLGQCPLGTNSSLLGLTWVLLALYTNGYCLRVIFMTRGTWQRVRGRGFGGKIWAYFTEYSHYRAPVGGKCCTDFRVYVSIQYGEPEDGTHDRYTYPSGPHMLNVGPF